MVSAIDPSHRSWLKRWSRSPVPYELVPIYVLKKSARNQETPQRHNEAEQKGQTGTTTKYVASSSLINRRAREETTSNLFASIADRLQQHDTDRRVIRRCLCVLRHLVITEILATAAAA